MRTRGKRDRERKTHASKRDRHKEGKGEKRQKDKGAAMWPTYSMILT